MPRLDKSNLSVPDNQPTLFQLTVQSRRECSSFSAQDNDIDIWILTGQIEDPSEILPRRLIKRIELFLLGQGHKQDTLGR